MNQKDFDKCHFNPLDPDFPVKAKRLIAVCDNAPLMKFIIAMYDPQSPMRMTYPEMGQRRSECGLLCGYSHSENITDMESAAAFEYLKIINSRLWGSMVVIEQSIWEYSKLMLQPMKSVDASDKTDKEIMSEMNMKKNLSASLVELNKQYDELSEKFYGGSEIKSIIEEKIVNYTPEAIAKLLRGNV